MEQIIPKVNSQRDLDPDFGQGIKSRCIVHLVHVNPFDTKIPAYNVVVLLPEYPYTDFGVSIVNLIMDSFLENGDRFYLLQIPDQTQPIGIEKGMPVIAFSPHKPDDFFWVTPPRHLWN